MSMAIFSPLSEISASTSGTLMLLDLVNLWHLVQARMWFLISSSIFGQVKCLFINERVALIPPWPRPS